MSVINKMLQDLDARSDKRSDTPPGLFYHVRPTGRFQSGWRKWLPIPLPLVVALLIYGGGQMKNTWFSTEPPATPLLRQSADTSAPQPPSIDEPGAATPANSKPSPASPPKAKTVANNASATHPPKRSSLSRKPAKKTSKSQPRSRQRPTVRPSPASPGESTSTIKRHSTPDWSSAFVLGMKAYQNGRRMEAEKHWREVLRQNPEHIEARSHLAGLYLNQSRQAQARQLLEEGVKHRPDHLAFALWLARMHYQDGAVDRAIGLLNQGYNAGKNDPEYWAFLGLLYNDAGHYASAHSAYARALRMRPHEPRYLLGMATALESRQQYPAAARFYRRVLASPGALAELRDFARRRLQTLTLSRAPHSTAPAR